MHFLFILLKVCGRSAINSKQSPQTITHLFKAKENDWSKAGNIPSSIKVTMKAETIQLVAFERICK